jgi:glycosyltransferase involved in cell wall biosynthesis
VPATRLPSSASPSGVPSHVSVIVPTRDRPEALSACLAALVAQTIADRLEVIVVDDGSRRAADVAAVVARHPPARLVAGAGAGPAAARNAGAAAAGGEILCFTDDDCVPHPDWAERLAAEIEGGADAAAGTTVGSGGALAAAAELVAGAPGRAGPRDGRRLAFAPSNNLACSKSVWSTVRFDESYPSAAAEDREWCARIAAAGYTLLLAPDACVVHRQALSLRTFLQRQVRYGEGAYRFRRQGSGSRQLEPPSFYAALLRSAFASGFAVGVLVAAAQVATALGFVRASGADRRRHR